MPSLRERFDDPIRAAAEGLSRLGFDDAEVMAVELDADPAAAETVEEYLREQHRLVWGGLDGTSTDREWETATEVFYQGLPTQFRLDWKWHAHKVVQQANAGLERFGYRTTVDVLAASDGPGTLRSEHPQAFVIRLFEVEGDDPVASVPVRLPPLPSERAAVLNHDAAAALLNHAVLDETRCEIVRWLPPYDDASYFAVLGTDRLDDLRTTFGEHVALFGEPLFERGLVERALSEYDPENESDHEATFGVPEPEGTFRLETHVSEEAGNR